MTITEKSSVEDQLAFYKRRCEYYKNKAKKLSYEVEDIRREWDRFRTKWARRKKNYRDMQRALEVSRMRERKAYDYAKNEHLLRVHPEMVYEAVEKVTEAVYR